MRQSHQQVELGLDPAEDFLRRREELDVVQTPEVANQGTAEVPDQARVGNQEARQEDEDQRSGPGGDLVRPKASTCQRRT